MVKHYLDEAISELGELIAITSSVSILLANKSLTVIYLLKLSAMYISKLSPTIAILSKAVV